MTESDQLAEDEVVALRYDEIAVTEELASWCNGEVARREGADGPDEDALVILVPTAKGPLPAQFGDWIVRRDEGDFYPCSPETFAALHQPLP